MKNLIYSKSVLDGGVTGSFSINRPTLTEKLYSSELTISVYYDRETSKFNFEVIKDRYGKPGNKTIKEAIKICADLLTKLKFDDRNKLFQTNTRLKLEEDLKKTLLCGDDIPKDILL